eukprot:1159696-Pelagomonas_calceolata.AAC.16
MQRKQKLHRQWKHSPHQIRRRGYVGPNYHISSPPEKQEISMGIRRVTSSSPCLISVMRVGKSLLKSASVADMFKRTGQNEHEASSLLAV